MSSNSPNRFKNDLGKAVHNWLTPSGGSYKIMLLAINPTFNASTMGTLDAFTGTTNNELNPGNVYTGTGNYQSGFGGTGRQAISTPTVTQDNTGNRSVWSAAANVWTSLNASNGTITGAVIFWKPTAAATDADCLVVAYIQFATTYPCNGQNFTTQPDATNGLLTIN